MTNESQHETALDSDEEQVGTLYAKAFLGSAGESAEALVSELEAVVKECLNTNPLLEQALSSPRISLEQKAGMLDRIFSGKVDGRLLNFLKILCRRGRIDSLRAIQVTSSLMLEKQLGKLRVSVTSAQPLSEDQKAQIASQLANNYGKQIVLVENVDESLLGGIVIRIGDKVFDGSVLGKLASLKTAVSSGINRAIREQYESLLSS